MSIDLDSLPEVDLHSAAYLNDPFGVLAPLRAQSPLSRSRRGIEVLRYDWIAELYADRRFITPDMHAFRAKGVPPRFDEFLENGFLLGFNGERHDRIRRVISKAFTIRRIEQERGEMAAVAEGLVDAFAGEDDGVVDLVAAYTERFPVEVLCRMLGVPVDDIPRFADAGRELHLMGAVPMAPGFPRIEAALGVLHDYVAELVARRRAEPGPDFVSALIEAERTEGKLSEPELVWNIANLLFAGIDTTRYQLASAVRALVEEPGDAWERLAADAALIPDALREAMRFYPTAQWSARIASQDCEYRGVAFPKGRRIFLSALSACRDESAFVDADRFDISRTGQRFDVPFGWGVHHCVGHALARSGMEVSLEVLTRRLRGLRVAGDVVLAKPSSMVGGPESLPIAFTPR